MVVTRLSVIVRVCAAVALLLACGASRAEAQLGNLISPGRLAKAHASLEGLSNCQKCHEQGRKVVADRCLQCHKPIADRIARRVGVHRDVKDDCVTCHVEHAGEDGQLRPFDAAKFDHAAATGFALEGKHAPLTAKCETCHKTRSFVTLSPSCASCHTDVHKGSLGRTCTNCHSARTAFKAISGTFDHTKAAFPLTGAHAKAACEACHKNQVFKGIKFASCSDCHRSPHPPGFGVAPASTVSRTAAPPGQTCASCHTTASWRTRQIDHNKTGFKLVGRHVAVPCASCHKQPATQVKLKADTCATCHADVHRGAFKQDCSACHTESSFEKGKFDHAGTRFALADRHAAVACTACHKNVAVKNVPVAKRVADYRGLNTTCASCHTDAHQGELGTTCETCHSAKSFQLPAFKHARGPEFFAGQHAGLACDQCHPRAPAVRAVRTSTATSTAMPLNVKFTTATRACASCHKDVHLGQEGVACERCHAIDAPKFAAPGFQHRSASFALDGKHQAIACAECHTHETGTFPAGSGTTVRYKGVASECAACHKDAHLGQVAQTCATCHSTTSFTLASYRHKNAASLRGFFVGRHASATCIDCHPRITGKFPAGTGSAMFFALTDRCTTCHDDVHKGALGPRCADCHRP